MNEPAGSGDCGVVVRRAGLREEDHVLNGFNLSRTPKRVTRMRGCARRSACTAAHSTNVLFTSSVPFPVSSTSRTNAAGHRRSRGARPGAANLQAARVRGERLWALDAALDFAVERARQLLAIGAQAVVAQAGQRAG